MRLVSSMRASSSAIGNLNSNTNGDKVGVVTPGSIRSSNHPRSRPLTLTVSWQSSRPVVLGERINAPRRGPSVRVPIARALGLDLLDRRAKKAVANVVKDLLTAGRLRVMKRRTSTAKTGIMSRSPWSNDHGANVDHDAQEVPILRNSPWLCDHGGCDHGEPPKPRRRSRFPLRGTTTATAAVWV